MTTAQRNTADRMIDAKGQAVTLTRQIAGEYDPASATSSITTSNVTGKGVILPLAAYRKSAGNIVAGDGSLYLSALDSTGAAMDRPSVDDIVTDINGRIYTVVAVDTVAPAGIDIMFDCVIRSAP